MHTKRLTVGDRDLARRVFATMAAVFDEDASATLSDEYLDRLLGRPEFWALAALRGDDVLGGLTAHTLPMTRAEVSELFIYDLAVRPEFQRQGVGRALVAALRVAGSAEGINDAFVPADNEDTHALDFYRAVGGDPASVTIFSFSSSAGASGA